MTGASGEAGLVRGRAEPGVRRVHPGGRGLWEAPSQGRCEREIRPGRQLHTGDQWVWTVVVTFR